MKVVIERVVLLLLIHHSKGLLLNCINEALLLYGRDIVDSRLIIILFTYLIHKWQPHLDGLLLRFNKWTWFLAFILEIDQAILLSGFLNVIFHFGYLWVYLIQHPVVDVLFVFVNVIFFIVYYVGGDVYEIEMLRYLIAHFLFRVLLREHLLACSCSSSRLGRLRARFAAPELPRGHSLLLRLIVSAAAFIYSDGFLLFVLVIDAIVIAVGASYWL